MMIDDGDDEEECAVEGVSAAWLSDAWGPR